MLIGREKERAILQNALNEEYSQFVAVYGRRRIGKTFLIRESFNYEFCFQYTGAANTKSRKQLARFRQALKEQGLCDVPVLTNWMDAFSELKRLINMSRSGKKVVFLDELPWMDAPRSGFLSELESFWNGWASARKDILLIVCGSSTSWMVKKIIKNKGGLHNRLTHRISLKPFTLGLCETLLKSRGIEMSRKQIIEGYMVFGGVPYYWSLISKGASISQEIDRLIFSEDGELHDEYSMLYASLFKRPEPYIRIVGTLAAKKSGLTRKEIMEQTGIDDNGALTEILSDMELCGFIRGYAMMGRKVKETTYQLIDNMTLFFHEFVNDGNKADNYWKLMAGRPRYNAWCGLAFERVCLWHVPQIKAKLGISGILSSEFSWRCHADKEKGQQGIQIDMIIDRSDGIIDICEMKYSDSEYSITAAYADTLRRRMAVFRDITKTTKAIHTILVTTHGLANNEYSDVIQNTVVADDLFA